MGNCLVTTLKDSVTDNNLLKLGDFRFYVVNNTGIRSLTLAADSSIPITIDGDGYFTDNTGTSNYGKETTYVGTSGIGSRQTFYLSRGSYSVTIGNKYSITSLLVSEKPITFALDDLFGCNKIFTLYTSRCNLEGDISVVKDMPLVYFQVGRTNVSGDINVISGKTTLVNIAVDGTKVTGVMPNISDMDSLTDLTIADTEIVADLATISFPSSIVAVTLSRSSRGNLYNIASPLNSLKVFQANHSMITGDIGAFANKTNLENLSIGDTSVSGNLSALAANTKLKTLVIDSTGVTGDTSSLANLTNLTTFNYANTAITGSWPLT